MTDQEIDAEVAELRKIVAGIAQRYKAECDREILPFTKQISRLMGMRTTLTLTPDQQAWIAAYQAGLLPPDAKMPG